jgi:two-component system, chemotaxis family, protein-glutamate methylesterase/glutaminase
MPPDDAARADAPARDLVVIGASAGGVSVLLDLAAALPADFPACVLVALHVGAHRSLLPELMGARGPLRAVHPHDGQALQRGTIFIAPPDHHMLVEDGRIRLNRGPRENHARPAIDPLFRTAALSHGQRVIGVVLSGRLDDGTAGLQAIKRCGGLAVVQDPRDAEYSDMPRSACDHVDVDICVPATRLAGCLLDCVRAPTTSNAPRAPDDIVTDQAISAGTGDPMDNLNAIGHPSRFACPECSGVLWEIDGSSPRRYRCHTGHGFTLRALAKTQDAATEDALWGAMRALQEREALLREMAKDADPAGRGDDGREDLVETAERVARHGEQLRDMITSD